jgi:hypothetical protein
MAHHSTSSVVKTSSQPCSAPSTNSSPGQIEGDCHENAAGTPKIPYVGGDPYTGESPVEGDDEKPAVGES